MNMNDVKIAGNLTRTPELKTSATGTTFATFTLAVNNTRKKDDVTYLDCIAFGKTAENLVQLTERGNNVMVEGRLSVRSYEDKTGAKRKSTEIIANSFNAITRKAKTAVAASADIDAELPV